MNKKHAFTVFTPPQKGTPKQDGFRHVPVRMESCRGLGILNIGIEFPGCLSLTFDSLDSPFLQVGQLHLFFELMRQGIFCRISFCETDVMSSILERYESLFFLDNNPPEVLFFFIGFIEDYAAHLAFSTWPFAFRSDHVRIPWRHWTENSQH